jgi:hypothetical protein
VPPAKPLKEEVAMGLNLSRALFVTVGGAILLMATLNLASGNSLTDPVFPLGLALGGLMIAAGIWTTSAGALPTVAVWLGALAVAITIVYFGEMVVSGGPHGADVWTLYLVPSGVMALAAIRIAIARASAGGTPVGSATTDSRGT